MKKFKIVLFFSLTLMSLNLVNCKKVEDAIVLTSYLDSFDSNRYYSNEFELLNYPFVYGNWEFYKSDGGFSGATYPPDFKYLIIKKIGIYGVVRNDTLIEYGKLVQNFDTLHNKFSISFISEFHKDKYQRFGMPGLSFVTNSKNTEITIGMDCCDFPVYHFRKIVK